MIRGWGGDAPSTADAVTPNAPPSASPEEGGPVAPSATAWGRGAEEGDACLWLRNLSSAHVPWPVNTQSSCVQLATLISRQCFGSNHDSHCKVRGYAMYSVA